MSVSGDVHAVLDNDARRGYNARPGSRVPMFTIHPAQRSRVGSHGSPRSVTRGDTRRLGRNIGGATFPFLTTRPHERTRMTALALPLSAYSGPTGEVRHGFGGGVCAGEPRRLVMGWFGHPSVAVDVGPSPIAPRERRRKVADREDHARAARHSRDARRQSAVARSTGRTARHRSRRPRERRHAVACLHHHRTGAIPRPACPDGRRGVLR